VLVAALPSGWGRRRAERERSGAGAPRRHREQYPRERELPLAVGGDYRKLWTAPTQVEVLNLQTFAGGSRP